MKRFTFILLFILYSCQPQKEALPLADTELAFSVTTNTSIRSLLARIKNSENGFAQISMEEDSLWLAGYVISDDRAGNFYKELWIQDAPENPTHGIKISIDRRALSDYFVRGAKVYVYLNGLGVGLQNGQPTLGEFQGNAIGAISAFSWEDHVYRTSERVNIVPKPMQFSALQEQDMGLWLRFDEVQFSTSELGKTLAGEAFDEYDGERRLLSCQSYHSLWLSSSSFSTFKSVVLPEGKGSITALLTRDFFDEKFILKANDPEDLMLTDSRCAPLFEESFEQVRLGLFQNEGWLNLAEEGSRFWEVYADENALGKSIKINSFRSGDERSVSWLILPPLDLQGVDHPVLTFRSSVHFADSSTLSVWVAPSIDAEFTATSWVPVAARIANRGDDPDKWIDSGPISLSDFPSGFRIGFRYEGSGKTSNDGTFELDDFFIVDQPLE